MEGDKIPPSAGDDADPALAVDAIHRVVGCFYGMLSVLHAPLTQFVASRRAVTPKLPKDIESKHAKLAKTGVRMQLLFMRDHWESHFTMAQPYAVLVDVRLLLQVLQQIQYSAAANVKTYQSGMAAIDRLLDVVGASTRDLHHVQTLKTMLSVHNVDQKSVESLASVQSSPVGGSNRRLTLIQQAKQIMDTNDQAAAAGDTVDTPAYDDAIALLDAALAFASTPNQRCRILTMRSECQMQCGREDLACEDGQAALATQIELTKLTAMKLVDVFKIVERWTDVATTCDLALQGDPEDDELMHVKTVALEMAARQRALMPPVGLHVVKQDQTTDELATRDDSAGADGESGEGTREEPVQIDEVVECLGVTTAQVEEPHDAEKILAAGCGTAPLPYFLGLRNEPEAANHDEKVVSPLAAHANRLAVLRKPTPSISSSRNYKDETPVEVPPWRKIVHAGLRYMQKKKLTAAEGAFTEALALIANEDDSIDGKMNILGHRARCRLLMKHYQLVVDDAQLGLQVDPDWLEGHRLACRGFMGLEKWSDALKECEIVRRAAPQDVNFKTFRAEIMRKMSGIDDESTTSPSTAPWNPKMQACVHAGRFHVEKKQYVEGEACFTNAMIVLKKFKGPTTDVLRSQSCIKVLGHRARCRLAMENWEGAAEDARAGIEIQADWIQGYRLLCHALKGANQWQKALDACERVLLHAPQDVEFAPLKAELELKCTEHLAAAQESAVAFDESSTENESTPEDENSVEDESVSESSEDEDTAEDEFDLESSEGEDEEPSHKDRDPELTESTTESDD